MGTRFGLKGRAILFSVLLVLGTVVALSAALIWVHSEPGRAILFQFRMAYGLARPEQIEGSCASDAADGAARLDSMRTLMVDDKQSVLYRTLRNARFTPGPAVVRCPKRLRPQGLPSGGSETDRFHPRVLLVDLDRHLDSPKTFVASLGEGNAEP